MNIQTLEARIQQSTEKRETRSKRLNLVVTPATHQKLRIIADHYNTSVNELANSLFEELFMEQNDLFEKEQTL